ncbi:hypothetical protein OEZ85_004689 [Tetradesmus obliquus]|uniref:ENTH domain-containing protein n=1 Tax=Tetradesmus obliquus TaxID=3088 RepID=A0ABY8UQ21_TETOB|nr:hypothetical protein OEZ85_004689 [Tetradesmus obliquus]
MEMWMLAHGHVHRYCFRKIEEATAQKDDPAPVYLLDEIADMARQSPEQAQAISDAVLKKLQVKSPVVKFKALRIIKHLCVKGCSQFQRCMQRNSSAVRELIHWRGEPDPFKGDVPNARVREFSKDVVEVLFNSAPITHTNNTLAAQGKIQGFGSGGPGEAAARSSSGHYGGIGSSGSNMGSGSYSGGFRSSGSSGLAAAQQAASQLTHAAQQALGEGPIAQGLASAANAIGGLLQPAGYGSRLNESGSYQDGGSDGFGYSSSSSYAAPAVSHVTASQVLGSEESVVDDITAPGGLRPLPDAADLRRFVDTASSMDGLRIAELLREKMESARWQVVLRALAALEAVLQRGSNQACGEQQHQQQALPMQQPDLLGDFSMAAGPQQMMMQQQQLGFGMQPQLQVNGLQQQQQQQQQQHFGMPGLGMQQQQQPQQQWGMPTMAAGAFPQQQQHGMHMHSGSSGGAAAGSSAWKGHDDVSNLMRQVGHGGKYDPAFDFVSDEFKKH